MTSPVSAPVKPGDLIAGKYRIERELARGGMGVVMAARHEALDQRVAVKFLLPEALAYKEAIERFEREARAAARLQSDYVTRVSDVGELPDGAPYMVMEYLEGGDLSAEVEARGALPITEAVDYVLQALEAVAEAHALGIVHRDLKPSNLFLATRPDRSRRVKVLDFGISKIEPKEGSAKAAITSTKSMLGSPGYMSPEQVRSSKSVDARTDIWSMGVILHELIGGAMLFGGDTLGEIFARILEEDPPALTALRPEVPAELGRVVAKCLERNRDKRFASVTELRDALMPFASERTRMTLAGASSGSISAKREGSPSRISLHEAAATVQAPNGLPWIAGATATEEAKSIASHTAATWTKQPDAASSRRWAALAGGAAVLAGALAFAGWRVLGGSSSAEPGTSAVTGVTASPVPPAMSSAPQVAVTPADIASSAPLVPASTASAAPAMSATASASPSSPRVLTPPRGGSRPGEPKPLGKSGLPGALQGRD